MVRCCRDVQDKTVQRRLGLTLVTTSLQCCGPLPEAPQTPTQAIAEGDAMAATPLLAEQQQREAVSEAVDSSPAMQVCGVPFAGKLSGAARGALLCCAHTELGPQ